jgi:predicted methyltransferase
MSVLSFAQKLVADRVRAGDTVIDATVGNGVDTLFLANLVGDRGLVYGFDIQEDAIAKTAARLQEHGTYHVNRIVQLIHDGHEKMLNYVEQSQRGSVAAAMFNLGYLPGSDHMHIITKAETTLVALHSALSLLRAGGVVTLVLYPGHDGGSDEALQVERSVSELSSQEFDVLCYRMLNRRGRPPYLLAIEKK